MSAWESIGRRGAAAALSGALALACAGPAPTEHTRSSPQALLNAQPSPVGTDDDAVLLLRAVASTELICTATLVAPNLVITTRHCIAFGGPPLFDCTREGVLIPKAPDGGTLGDHLPADSIELYGAGVPRDVPLARGTQVLSSESDSICRDDIAFVVLDRALDLPVLPIRIGTPPYEGEPITLVGYGVTLVGEQLAFETQARLRLAGRQVRYVGPATNKNPIDAPPRTFIINGPASCFGDSGGPAIAEQTGAVIGVFSLVDGDDCGAEGVELFYTQTSPFAELANAAFAAAGAAPNFEPEPETDAGAEPSPDAGPGATGGGADSSGCHLASREEGGEMIGAWLAVVLALLGVRRTSAR